MSIEDDPEADAQPSAVDPVQHRKARSRKKRAEQESNEFWEFVYSSEVGRREMWQLFDSAGAFKTKFGNSPVGFAQPEASWFYAGQADFALRMYQSALVRFPEHVAAMHRENDVRLPKPKGK